MTTTNLSTLPGFGTSSGGGGSTGIPQFASQVDAITLYNGGSTSPRTASSSYSGTMAGQAPGGIIKDRYTFGYWSQWYYSAANQTGFTVCAFHVDKSTGALSNAYSAYQDVWTNTSGAATSTTYCLYDPVHGCFFSGGHNAYPGYSSHVFGYTKGQLTTSGQINGGSGQYTNTDHGYNGSYCACLPQGTGTQYFLSGGYQSSYAGRRLITCNASGISVGGFSQNGSWTSSSNAFHHVWQPDIADTPSGQVTSCHGTSFQTNNYGWQVLRDSSMSQFNNITNGYQRGMIYAGYGGTTVLTQSSDYYGTLGSGSNSFSNLKDGERDLGNHTSNGAYETVNVGIGNNRFLLFHKSGAGEGKYVDLIDFDSSNNPRHIKRFSFGSTGEESILDGSSGNKAYYVVYENSADNYPKWFVQMSWDNGYTCTVKSFEITLDLSTYTA
mgnify:CR=1 FL=1